MCDSLECQHREHIGMIPSKTHYGFASWSGFRTSVADQMEIDDFVRGLYEKLAPQYPKTIRKI